MRVAFSALLMVLTGLVVPAASPVAAAPAQGWLGVAGVQALLNASPDGVPGHFLTVLGGPTAAQQAPTDLPLTVLSVVPDAGPAGALLLVRLDLTDPAMARIGNIAAGMSGSPVLVRVAGVDKVVGALSYGDSFTTDGLALATPIEDMRSVEGAGLTSSAVAAVSTPRPIPPITVGGRTISRVVVDVPGASARSGSRSMTATEPGTAHFTPLLGIQIGGLPAQSRAYRRLASAAVSHGLRVLTPHGSGPAGSAAGFQTPLVPGASAGTFFSLGDLPVGGVGTVTYTTTDGGVVAFGHPLLWSGATAAFFTNAWIDGVWSSTLGSYKLGSPSAVRGTLVQDRAAGVGARLDKAPAAVTLTSSASVTSPGRVATRTGVTRIAPITFATWLRSDLPATAADQPVLRAADAGTMPGSAATTMTITVSDGVRDHRIHRTNLYDDGDDVLWQPGLEVYDALEAVLANPNGTTPAQVKAIALTTKVTSTRARATILGITGPALRTGANTLTVLVRAYGSTDTRKVPVTLTIPEGMPVRGVVSAKPGSDVEVTLDGGSLGALVASLNGAPANSDIVVSFQPEDLDLAPVRAVARTAHVIQGSIDAATSAITLAPSAVRITAGQRLILRGVVDRALSGDTVRVERQTRGSSTWQSVDPAVPLTIVDEQAGFEVTDQPMFNSTYRVSYPGSGGTVLGSSAAAEVAVRGAVTVRGSRTTRGFRLTAVVTPAKAGSKVTFERLRHGTWRSIKAVRTSSAGRASYTWRVGKGTYTVRARLSGSTALTGNASRTITLRR